MTRPLGLVFMIMLIAAGSAPAATITTYSTRAAFDLAVAPTTLEDLNSQTPSVSFIGTALDLGPFEVLLTGSDVFFGEIEAGTGPNNIDGTTYGNVLTSDSWGDVVFTFDSAITAFGLDVDAWNDYFIRTTVKADGTNVPVTAQVGVGSRFFGFSSDVSFTEVRFVGGNGDGWGFDNIAFTDTSVPEPSSLVLWAGLGVMGLIGARRRKRAA